MNLLKNINGMILYCENTAEELIANRNSYTATKYTNLKYSLEQVKEEIIKLGSDNNV